MSARERTTRHAADRGMVEANAAEADAATKVTDTAGPEDAVLVDPAAVELAAAEIAAADPAPVERAAPTETDAEMMSGIGAGTNSDETSSGAAGAAGQGGDGPARSGKASDGLGHKTSRGVAVTAGGLWAKTLIQTVSTIVLARLLDPSAFGLIAMVTAITGVADLVRDFGMTGAIIQSRSLSRAQWSSVLWLSAGIGLVLMIAIGACSPLIAALYGEPALVPLTLAIAPVLLINGLCMPMQAKVQREMRFGFLANIDVVSMLIGVALSTLAAWAGWGVWSLVVLTGSAQVYRLIALWVIAKPHFGAPRIDRSVVPLVTTGGSIFGVQLLNYAARNVDNIVVGQQLGAAALGQYSRAYSLFLLPLQQLTGPLGRVALPVLSALQDDAARFRRYVRGALMVIGYLSLPTYAIAAAVSGPLIRLLLGPQWGSAAAIFSILAIAGVAQAIGNVQGWLYISLGRAHRQLVYYVITRPIVIAGFFVGIWWAGVNGLAFVYSMVTLLLLVPGFSIAIRGTFVRASDIVAPLVRPAILAPLSFLCAWAVEVLVPLPTVPALVAGVAAGLLPFAASFAVPAYRGDYGELVAVVKQMRKPKTRPAETKETAS